MEQLECDCNIIHKDVVEKAIKRKPKASEIDNLSKLFKTIGDKTRVQILWLLDNNEMCVCDIANVLNMTKSAISHQLSILKNEKIVKSTKIGKEVFYKLDDEHITALYELGLEHIKHLE